VPYASAPYPPAPYGLQTPYLAPQTPYGFPPQTPYTGHGHPAAQAYLQPMMTPYMAPQGFPGFPAVIPPGPPPMEKLERPGEAECHFDKWHAGANYSPVLDIPTHLVLKCSLALNPLLIPPTEEEAPPPLNFDILLPEKEITLNGEDPPADWAAQVATFPRVSHLRFIAEPTPWTIDVHNSAGVTVGDIVRKFSQAFGLGVGRKDWERLPKEAQEDIGEVYTTNRDRDGRPPGVRRVDYLKSKRMFLGLAHDEALVTERLGPTFSAATYVIKLGTAPEPPL